MSTRDASIVSVLFVYYILGYCEPYNLEAQTDMC